MVFSNPEVIDRVNKEFIPVALKAAMVNNPPRGIEGDLYAEIRRSKPTPQGICTANSAGKVIAWALSFDDDNSILKFLDHVRQRYEKSPDALSPESAERFMKFPSRKLADVEDNGEPLTVPEQHAQDDRCPAKPALEEGTLVGRIVGRPLDSDGDPIAETLRQEDYMEARFEIAVVHQQQLAEAVQQAAGKPFEIPSEFARSVVSHAFLGQLDVNPLGDVPGSRNDSREWEFVGEAIESDDPSTVRVCVEGTSSVAGGQDDRGVARSDGRLWEHKVTLTWYGFVDIQNERVARLSMIANGDERLRWGNARFSLLSESDAEHLMAGHPIDLECKVRYGLFAEPCSPDEVVSGAGGSGPADSRQAIRAKMDRLQAGMQRLRQFGGDPREIAELMREFGPLMQQGQVTQAESLLDRALRLLDER